MAETKASYTRMREREVSGLDASGDVTTHAIEDELVTKRKPRRSKKPALSDSNQIRNGNHRRRVEEPMKYIILKRAQRNE